jgi:hypothetical protein
MLIKPILTLLIIEILFSLRLPVVAGAAVQPGMQKSVHKFIPLLDPLDEGFME